MQFTDLPSDVQGQLQQLHRLVSGGRYAEAVGGLAHVVRDHPRYLPAYVMLGRALRMSGQRERSHACYRQAAELAPDDLGVRLGLAWTALDHQRWREAMEHATLASRSATFGADALAVVARCQEATDDAAAAAATFLAAYQRKPIVPWLEAHCRLVGRAFAIDPVPAWTLTLPERFWLYYDLEDRLAAIAESKSPHLPPSQLLPAGCDHTPRWTTEWLHERGFDAVEVYQQLAARGGFCDCEVAINAAREDDELGAIYLAGHVSGRVGREMWTHGRGQLLTESLPAPLDPPLEEAPPALHARFEAERLVLPPQRAAGVLLGFLLRQIVSNADAETRAALVLVYPEGQHVADVVTVRGDEVRGTSCAQISEVHAQTEVEIDAVEALATTLPPPPDLGVYPAALGLEGARGCLLLQLGHRWELCDAAGQRQPLDVVASQLVADASGDHWAWLVPRGRRCDLMIEDRVRGERRCIEREFFSSSLSLSPDGRRLYFVRRGEAVERDLQLGTERRFGRAEKVAVSPSGAELVVVDRQHLHLYDVDSATRRLTVTGIEPKWSPDGRYLAHSHRPDGERWQVFLLEVATGQRRKMVDAVTSAWPSFTADGRHMVLWGSVKAHQTPAADGRIRLSDDERLFRCPVDGAPSEILLAYDDSYMRITSPLVRPTTGEVVFRTQDRPMHNRRLVVLRDGQVHDFMPEYARPHRWL